MAKVRKLNRMLTVSDQAVESYLKEGYDQVDSNGKIIKRATGGKAIPLAEHNRVLDELNELKQDKDNEKIESELEKVKKENSALRGKVTKLENEAKKDNKK